MVKLYCPKCMDVYTPKSSRHHHTDGAYFGTGFPHMLFMVHPEYRPKKPTNQFVPRLYGFKIHPLAYQIQQQGASNFKVPMRTVSYNNGRKWNWICLFATYSFNVTIKHRRRSEIMYCDFWLIFFTPSSPSCQIVTKAPTLTKT